MVARLALLAGLFLVPCLLLWVGHGLRGRSVRKRGAFWGGVIGHSAGLLIAVVALHYPPVLWTGAPRMGLALWSLLVGGAAGALIGAIAAED